MSDNILDYQQPVHKSLLQPDFFAGIPKNLFYVIGAVTLLSTQIIGKFALLVGIVIYIPCRILSKKDSRLISISAMSLFEPSNLEA